MIVKQASVELKTAYGVFHLTAFSDKADDPMPHLAISSDNLDTKSTQNVRIHSECITGDLFKSKRCECGEQLEFALDYISKYGGVVVYLRQEGRGIGIINKIKAYVEQDKGFNTAEANQRLGFGFDDRDYTAAISILESLGVRRINLLTNNPDKVKAFENTSIQVQDRVPIEMACNHVNEGYLKTKKEFFGHMLELI